MRGSCEGLRLTVFVCILEATIHGSDSRWEEVEEEAGGGKKTGRERERGGDSKVKLCCNRREAGELRERRREVTSM